MGNQLLVRALQIFVSSENTLYDDVSNFVNFSTQGAVVLKRVTAAA